MFGAQQEGRSIRACYFRSTLGHGYALSTDEKGGHLPVGLGAWALRNPVDLNEWSALTDVLRDLMSKPVYLGDAKIPIGRSQAG